MKYDDASWHYGGDFPEDLPSEAGGTHIAMFVSWCLLNGLAGEVYDDETPDLLKELRDRTTTPCAWFFSACDEKFTDEDLSDEGNAFAQHYYAGAGALYLDDYLETIGTGLDSLYHVPDSWGTFDSLAPVICERHKSWKASN